MDAPATIHASRGIGGILGLLRADGCMLGSPCTDSKPHHSPQDEEAELLLLPHHQRQRPRVTLVPVPLGRLASLRKNRKVDASSPFRASPGLCGILGPLRAKGGTS